VVKISLGNFKIKFKVNMLLKIEEDFSIGGIDYKSIGDEVFAEVLVWAENVMIAQQDALSRMSLVSSSLSKRTNQVIEYYIFEAGEVNEEGKFKYAMSTISATLSVRRKLEKLDIQKGRELSELAGNNEKLKIVLNFINKRDYRSWVQLYKIYEVINSDQDIIKKGWVSKGKLNLFKHTANNPDASGRESRHGFSKGEVPSKPMHLDEAVFFIEDIFENWIQHLKINL
jgi:hypothetical protein